MQGVVNNPYSTDDVIRFWRSKVKVTAACRDGEGINDHLVVKHTFNLWSKRI